jgi:hypothetical protein
MNEFTGDLLKRISETEISKVKMVSASDYLSPFRVVPPGAPGVPRGACESCGLYLWDDGGYKIPGLDGIYCSVLCIECAIADATGETKKIPGRVLGDGYRLQVYLRFLPEMYHRQRLESDAARKKVLTGEKTAKNAKISVDNKGFM